MSRLRNALLTKLRTVLEGVTEWDLVDYPNYFNCGDSAIWLGQRVIGRALDIQTMSVSTFASYDKRTLKADGPVVITGGGNFGGLYPHHHDLRLQLFAELKGRPLLQMPQSVEFRSNRHRDELRAGIDAHGNFTLLVRDDRSYERAAAALNCRVLLVPDAAYALGPQEPPSPSAPLAVQMRQDSENGGAAQYDLPWRTFDWLKAGPGDSRWNASRILRKTLGLSSRGLLPASSLAIKVAADHFARKNLAFASDLLGRGELLVTDRLHGHIVAELLGIPHIVVNDRYGKISAFWDTWGAGTGELISTWDDAEKAVARRNSQARGGPQA